MTATFDSVLEAALTLSEQDRCAVASRLWESAASEPADFPDESLEQELARRDAELDSDPALEVSHGDFLSHFSNRRLNE